MAYSPILCYKWAKESIRHKRAIIGPLHGKTSTNGYGTPKTSIQRYKNYDSKIFVPSKRTSHPGDKNERVILEGNGTVQLDHQCASDLWAKS